MVRILAYNLSGRSGENIKKKNQRRQTSLGQRLNPGHPSIKQEGYPLDGNIRCETERQTSIGIVWTSQRNVPGISRTNIFALGGWMRVYVTRTICPDGSNLEHWTGLHNNMTKDTNPAHRDQEPERQPPVATAVDTGCDVQPISSTSWVATELQRKGSTWRTVSENFCVMLNPP